MMLLEHRTMWNVAVRGARRGSILVLVLGILAMMAVFAAVYLSIGVGDQRAAQAVESRQDQQSIAPVVADHLASTIARDRLAVLWRSGGSDGGIVSRPYRETTDYPYTDYSRLSIPALENHLNEQERELYRFNPEGSHPREWLGQPGPDPRVEADSYLASTEPTFLGSPQEREEPGDPMKWWLDKRDWAHISNFAPNGLFVNLYALRNNFDAESGIEDPEQMSYGLTIIKRTNTADGVSQLESTPLNSTQSHIPGLSITALEMRNRPYFWTMNQRNMFFPIGQAFPMNEPGGGVAGWGSEFFPDYQYADADGDGFADSRWFEMKDSTIPGRVQNMLSGMGGYRFFIAARAIDLSGLVNVNTATDSSIAPTSRVPLGSSPAEIDVRRLLTMEDAAQNYESVVGNRPVLPAPVILSYSSIPWPPLDLETGLSSDPASDYSFYGYESSDPTLSAPNAGWVGWFGYDALHRSFGIPSDFWEDPQAPTATLATDLRGYVYNPLDTNFPYDNFVQNYASTEFNGDAAANILFPNSPFEFAYTLQSEGETEQTPADMDHRGLMRLERYESVGSVSPHDPTDRAAEQDAFSLRFGRELFGVADLSELLTYRGLNDPAATSRLEATLDGRYDDEEQMDLAGSLITTRRFGPLRSNRALAYERNAHDDTIRGSEFGPATGSDGIMDADALALMELSPRLRLTTLSGAADILGVEPLTGSPGQFATELQDSEIKPRFRGLAQNLQSSFDVYRSALAGYAIIDDAWEAPGTASFEQYRTAFYGYGGPELAMRTTAHLSVNLWDQYDEDHQPKAATLILSDQTGYDIADADDDNDWVAQEDASPEDRRLFPGGVSGGRLRPSEAHRSPAGGTVDAGILNVYGIEPQPFIVEAMSINVHTDAPMFADPGDEPNGDRDFNVASCLPFDDNRPPRDVAITIGGKLDGGEWSADGLDDKNQWDANADFVMQVFAVKLHNPFNQEITLGAGASGPLDGSVGPAPQADDVGPRNFDYYIEFGGRYFKLAQYLPPTSTFPQYRLAPVTLKPGQSRVFYVLAQEDEQKLLDRWQRYVDVYYGTGGPVPRASVQEWLETQFDMTELGSDGDPVWIRRFNPETGLLINVEDSRVPDPDAVQGTVTEAGFTFDDLWEYPPDRDGNGDVEPDYLIPSEASGGGESRQPDWRVVRLWKKFRSDIGPDDAGNPDRVESNWTGQLSLLNDEPGTDNWVENDILIDRLREPDPEPFIQVPDEFTPTPEGMKVGFLDSRPRYRGGYDEEPFDPARTEVDGTKGCEQSLDDMGGDNDNTGWTIAMYSFIRRNGFADNWAARESDGEDRMRRGVLPMWCIEAIGTNPGGVNASYNIPGEQIPDGSLDEADFSFSSSWAFRTFKDFLDESSPVEESFNLTPNEWDGPADGTEWPTNRTQAVNKNLYGDFLYGQAYAANQPRPREAGYLFPELHVRSDKYEFDPGGSADPIDVSRVTDVLTPMAIGPEYAPLAPSSFGDPFVRVTPGNPNSEPEPGRYLTLSEALGLALGFDGEIDIAAANGDVIDGDGDGVPDGDGTVDPTVYNRFVYFDLGKRLPLQTPGSVPDGDWEYVFDAGHLWLDKFVLFVDETVHYDAGPPEIYQILYEVDGTAPDDVAIGQRVTPAMKLLDSVQTATDTTSPEAFLGRAVPGRVNINTAPLAVLRTIGMLSPSTAWDAFGVPEHWAWRVANVYGGGTVQADSSGFGLQDPALYIEWARDNLGLPDISLMDSAATLLAYRDRLNQTEFRASSWPSDPATGLPVLDPLAYSGFAADDASNNPYQVTPTEEALVIENRSGDRGRQSITNIPGLRETPGFGSLGEVIAARVRPDLEDAYLPAGLPFLAEEVAGAQLDYLGTDKSEGLALELMTFESQSPNPEFHTVLESRRYTNFDPFDSNTSYDEAKAFYADEIGNDYDEKLVLTSQLLNLVTTRSDLFAVWFIVRGYTEADVTNLGDNDAMLPSLERRYLMIVDRSKVGTWIDRDGDGQRDEESELVGEPEIVLLREVPM